MKPLQDLRQQLFHTKASKTTHAVKNLLRPSNFKLDLDVFLPSINKNLQRDFVWSISQSQELIMSILLERPIPHLSFYIFYKKGDEVETIQIIDGKQRLSSIIDFINNEYHINIEDSLFQFKHLPTEYQQAILDCALPTFTIYDTPKLTDQDKIDWFKTINFGGTLVDVEHLNNLK